MQTVPCSRATYCRGRRLWFLYFPHHFWRVPRLFLDDKLDGDSICLKRRHFDGSRCHLVLTSLTKEELAVFSCLESLKRQLKRKLQGVAFSYSCVSRARKSIKRCSKEPPDHYDRGVIFISSDIDLKK